MDSSNSLCLIRGALKVDAAVLVSKERLEILQGILDRHKGKFIYFPYFFPLESFMNRRVGNPWQLFPSLPTQRREWEREYGQHITAPGVARFLSKDLGVLS